MNGFSLTRLLLTIVAAGAVALWFLGADDRRDAALYAELASAPFSRFDESFYLGEPGEGRIRLLPLEERPPRRAALKHLIESAERARELESHVVSGSVEDFKVALALADSEVDGLIAGARLPGEFRHTALEPLDDIGRARLEQRLDANRAAAPMFIDRRNEIFARRVAETTRQLEAEFGADGFSVFVFTGAAHVPGVTRLLREALAIDTDAPPVDIGRAFEQALAGVEVGAKIDPSVQLREALNALIPDADVGPVRIRSDVHSPFFDTVRVVDPEFFMGLVTDYEPSSPVSIARYAAVVEEVRQLARAGRRIVFFTELDALTLVDTLRDIHRERRFETFRSGLAALPERASAELSGTAGTSDDASATLDAYAARLFPYFHAGPAALLFAKLDEATLAPALRRALEH